MTPRVLTIGLIVSIVLNAFLVGGIGGAFIMRQRMIEQRANPPRGGNPIMRVSDRMPAELRTRYLARMRAEGQNNRPKMAEARQARAEAVRALSAETYDPAAAAAALARAREAETAMRAGLENAVLDFSRNLTQEQRRLIAQTLRGGPPGGPRRGGPGRDGQRGDRDGRPPFEGPGAGFGPPPEGPPPPPGKQ